MYCHIHHCHYHHCNCVPTDSTEKGGALTQEELLAYTQEMKKELKDYTVDLKDQIFSYIDVGLNPVEIANTFASLKEQDTYVLKNLTKKIDELNNSTNLSMFNLRTRVTDLEGQSATLINDLVELENNFSSLPFEDGVLADTFVTATANSLGSVARTQRDKNSDSVNLLDFGGKPEVGFDNSNALRSAIATGKEVVISGKNAVYELHKPIVTKESLLLDFKDGASLKAENKTGVQGVAIEASGDLNLTTTLSADANKGSRVIEVAEASGLNAGDVISIYNRVRNSYLAEPNRTTYMSSEFVVIESIIDNVVNLQTHLYDSYPAADTDIYKLEPIKLNLNNPDIKCDGSFSGVIKASNIRSASINNPNITNKKNNSLMLAACFGGNITAGSVVNKGETNDVYGIVIAESQNININGGYYYGRNHGVMIGNTGTAGASICRNIKVNGATISNNPDSGTHCADMHGNTESCSYINCDIQRGVNYQGKNHTIKDNRIGSYGDGLCITFAEIVGGVADIRNNTFDIKSDPSVKQFGVINCKALRSMSKEPLTINLKDNTFKSENLSATTDILLVENNGSNHKLNIEFTGNNFDVNNMRSAAYLRRKSGVADSDYIIIDNNKLRAGQSAYSLAPASDGYSHLNCLKLQSNYWSTTATLTSNGARVDTSIKNFKWKYPIAPSVQSNISGVSGQTLTDLVTTLNLYVATDKAQLSVVPINKTTFESTNTVNVSARAYIDNIS